ncbi:hypothetical protein BMW23_0522 [Bodo saltans virus]|uniref:Uncharacterized protein n=1 Tax=Bodo saltans virus TaxID=2024608 RepID=A0A2H4UUP8_9VIRU|nr:hypothetical protein QJ851_gp0506 [Bodo saltans virus]ATZ80569.1 hypothetical protein BMW23_0522 [Bodo saltans virus]
MGQALKCLMERLSFCILNRERDDNKRWEGSHIQIDRKIDEYVLFFIVLIAYICI